MEKRFSEAGESRRGIGQRSKAQFPKGDARSKEAMDIQRRRQEDEEAKLKRLKSLRLAKEASDREEVAKAAQSAPPPRPRRKKKAEPLPAN